MAAVMSDKAASGSLMIRETLHFAEVAEHLRRSTVRVSSERRREGGGSGVLWPTVASGSGAATSGVVITNAHVVRRNSRVQIEMSDKRVFDARVAVRDDALDLAALILEGIETDDLPAAAPRRDSASLRVGELALAIGNPFGTERIGGALTIGIVHGRDQRWVRADVRLAPGNSGGPLADAEGRIIGINTMIARGLALAVPTNAVENFLLRSTNSPREKQRPRLGITALPIRVPHENGYRLGLVLIEVQGGSPAEKGGLLLGDVLLGAAGRSFTAAPADLAATLSLTESVAGAVPLELLRGGQQITHNVVITGDEMDGSRSTLQQRVEAG